MSQAASPPYKFPATVESFVTSVVLPIRLACNTPGRWPAVLSLWYLYEDGALYCATQADALVVSYLQHEPKCAFEIAGDLPPYCGVRGQAWAEIVPRHGPEILPKLLARYLGGTDSPLAQKLLARSETEVAIRLEPANSYAWNFTKRMKGIARSQPGKICPEV